MALTTGSDYDHIDISDGTDTIRHNLKDTVARNDLIKAQSSQPSESGNKIWFPDTTPEGVEVPTYAEFSDLKSAISQNTYNLIEGIISTATINSSGRLIYDASDYLAYAPVTSGGKYTVKNTEASLVYGFTTTIPASGDYTYNNTRYISTSKTITAGTTGYIVFRCLNADTSPQIVSGESDKEYLPPTTATDYVARNRIAEVQGNVDNLEGRVFSKQGTLYEGLPAGGTYSSYSNASGYSVCSISEGDTLNKISVLAPNNSNPLLAFIYEDNGSYFVENYVELSTGTGSYVTDTIDYTVKHDCLIVLSGGFMFITDGTAEHPMIFTYNGSMDVNTATEGIAGLAYTVTITYTKNGAIVQIEEELENMQKAISPNVMASALSMFEHIGVCGDSYAAGMIVTGENPLTTATNANLSWGKNLGRQMGVSVSLYAKGGVKAGDYISDSACLPALLADTAQDLYIISLGHNDMYNNTSAETFAENYGQIIESIKEHAPNALIVLCKQSRPYANYKPSLNDTIEEIAEDYEIPVLDPENDPYTSSETWLRTMVHNHPVFAGYAGMAQAINRQFAKATVDYFDYFKGYTGN